MSEQDPFHALVSAIPEDEADLCRFSSAVMMAIKKFELESPMSSTEWTQLYKRMDTWRTTESRAGRIQSSLGYFASDPQPWLPNQEVKQAIRTFRQACRYHLTAIRSSRKSSFTPSFTAQVPSSPISTTESTPNIEAERILSLENEIFRLGAELNRLNGTVQLLLETMAAQMGGSLGPSQTPAAPPQNLSLGADPSGDFGVGHLSMESPLSDLLMVDQQYGMGVIHDDPLGMTRGVTHGAPVSAEEDEEELDELEERDGEPQWRGLVPGLLELYRSSKLLNGAQVQSVSALSGSGERSNPSGENMTQAGGYIATVPVPTELKALTIQLSLEGVALPAMATPVESLTIMAVFWASGVLEPLMGMSPSILTKGVPTSLKGGLSVPVVFGVQLEEVVKEAAELVFFIMDGSKKITGNFRVLLRPEPI